MTIHPHIQKGMDLSEKNNLIKPIPIIDKHHVVETICPVCGSDVYFYSAGEPREHHCTVCNVMVEISMGAILA